MITAYHTIKQCPAEQQYSKMLLTIAQTPNANTGNKNHTHHTRNEMMTVIVSEMKKKVKQFATTPHILTNSLPMFGHLADEVTRLDGQYLIEYATMLDEDGRVKNLLTKTTLLEADAGAEHLFRTAQEQLNANFGKQFENVMETRVPGGSYDGVSTFHGEIGGLAALVRSKTLNRAFRNTHDEMHFEELGIKEVLKWPMYAKVINMMSNI